MEDSSDIDMLYEGAIEMPSTGRIRNGRPGKCFEDEIEKEMKKMG